MLIVGLGIGLIVVLIVGVYWFNHQRLNRAKQLSLDIGNDEERIPKELLKKVKQIEISTRQVVNEVFSGEYHSVFKGRGMEFSEVREYQPGDDVRNIDWNVTARMGHPFIKVFEEERELTVMLMVDVSSSGNFGTALQLKREIAAEISAILAFSAIKNKDKVGLLIFSDSIEKFIPPRKGKKHVLRVIREILFFKPQESKTDLSAALEYLNRVIRRKSTVFLLSDFLTEDYQKALQVANKKHDIIAMSITDPREMSLPDVGMLELEDAETGETLLVDTSSKSVRNTFYDQTGGRFRELDSFFKSIGVDHINIKTDRSYIEPINKFFRMRAKRLAS
ncbi:MAG: DUF58 domain-containing protein [Caldithrix sp.]|nr:DUF58 domain-containing protein [Caldithrix sp.]